VNKIVRFLFRIDDLVLKLFLAVCAVILVAMVLIEAMGVFFRFVLRSSLSWTDEAVSYLFVWLTCLGAAAGFKLRAHPEVKALFDRLPKIIQKPLSALADVVVLILGVILLRYGGEMISLMGMETAASLPISMTYPYLAIPVAGVAMIFHSVCHVLRLFYEDERQPARQQQDDSHQERQLGDRQPEAVAIPDHTPENVNV
jgi:TRAP-type C4-dicarboxylate transport system permease small subunit